MRATISATEPRGPLEPLGAIKQVVRQAPGDRFAEAGLRRNQQVAAGGIVGQYRGLDLRKPIEVTFRQSSGERRWVGNNVTRCQTPGWLYQPEMLNTASNRNGSRLAHFCSRAA